MDENRNKSIVFFVMMGIGFFVAVLYAFVIGPNMNKKTLGTSDLVLELPIQKRSLRYSENGITPFCLNDSTSLTMEVTDSITVYAATDGIVIDNSNNAVSIESTSGIYIEYSPIKNFEVLKGDFVAKGSMIGRVNGNYFSLSIKDTRREKYECPYNFLNDFGKMIIDDGLDITGYDGSVCVCDNLNY